MNLIVAVDKNWAIGNQGDQLIYIPEDLKRFKQLTMNHPVILGRKTLMTFPSGKPLKNRRNLILSNNVSFATEGAEVFHNVNSLLDVASPDSFVIGGASIYNLLLNHCDIAYVTKIDAEFPADTWFPNLDHLGWKIIEESEFFEYQGIRYHYVTYNKERA